MAFCDLTNFVEDRRELVITQYRESENLRFLMDTYVAQLQLAAEALCEIASAFNLSTALDDQLTILGASLGWPRTHCNAQKQAVFGFDCATACNPALGVTVGGLCDSNFRCGCHPALLSYTFTDDLLYLRFLLAKIESQKRDYTHSGIEAAADLLFNTDTNAVTAHGADATVNIYINRVLTAEELSVSALFPQVLPIAPGVSARFWQSGAGVPAFGFGPGWGEMCTGEWAQRVHEF